MKQKTLTITNKTLWEQVAPFWSIVSRETKAKFYEKVQQYYKVVFWEMSIKQLYKVVNGEYLITPNNTAFCQIFFLGLKEWADSFVKLINRYTPKGEDQKNNVVKLTFAESVFIEMQQYFYCRSFAEVEQLKVSDYILMRKAKYNQYLAEKASINRIKQQRKCQR